MQVFAMNFLEEKQEELIFNISVKCILLYIEL